MLTRRPAVRGFSSAVASGGYVCGYSCHPEDVCGDDPSEKRWPVWTCPEEGQPVRCWQDAEDGTVQSGEGGGPAGGRPPKTCSTNRLHMSERTAQQQPTLALTCDSCEDDARTQNVLKPSLARSRWALGGRRPVETRVPLEPPPRRAAFRRE